VIWQFEICLRAPETDRYAGGGCYGGATPLFQRRLTPDGVDLVLSGAIQPSALLDEASSCAEGAEVCPSVPSALPAGAWADAEISIYEPSRWAMDAPSEAQISRFPAAAQPLLRGRELTTYNDNNVWLFFPEAVGTMIPTPGYESVGCCFELTTAEVSALRAALIDAGIPEVSAYRAAASDGGTPFVSPDWLSLGPGPDGFPEHGLNLHLNPILPHGDPIATLG
jgi:hypothetical protein